MGNSCCPPSSSCDQTVDETKGLLSSSESKASTKADGSEGTGFSQTEVVEESKNEELDKEVITSQPSVVNKCVEASSYRAVMDSMHTDVSRAAQTSQSSSPEVSKEPVEDSVEKTGAKEDTGKEETQTSADDTDALPDSAKATLEKVTAEQEEKKAVPVADVATVTALTVQNTSTELEEAPLDATKVDIDKDADVAYTKEEDAVVEMEKKVAEGNTEEEDAEVDGEKEVPKMAIEKEDVEVDGEKEAPKVAIEKEDVEVDGEKEAPKVAIEKKDAEVDGEKEAPKVAIDKKDAEVDGEKEAPKVVIEKEDVEVDGEKEAPKVAIEKKDAEVDGEKEAPKVAIEKKDAEVDVEKVTAEVDTQKKAAEEHIEEEKPKTSVEKDSTQTEQPALNDSTAVKYEAEHLAPTDVVQNESKADTSVTENGGAEPQTSSPESSSELDVVEESVSAKVNTEEPVGVSTDKMENKQEHKEKEDNLPSETQEHSEKMTPAGEFSNELTPHSVENGQVDDLKDDNSSSVDAECGLERPQETELPQKTCEEPSCTVSEAQLPKTCTNIISTVEESDESTDTAADQEKTAELVEKEQEPAESLLNGLNSTTPVEKSEAVEACSDPVQLDNVESGSSEAFSLDDHIQEEDPKHRLSTKENEETTTVVQEMIEKEGTEGCKVQKGEIIVTSSHAVEVALIPVSESISVKEEQQQEDEDLYRGAEEIEQELPREKQPKPLLEVTIPGVEEKCSLAPTVDILAYSESEWKGNTAKSTLIRKGYSEMSCSFSGLRRVRGDNYCALRATLYQVLATTTQTPAWLRKEDFTLLPEKLEAQGHLISGWTFPSECWKAGQKEDAVEKLKHYLELLQKMWQAAAESESLEEKQRVCERVFQGTEEEYGLLEVLKFLMLARAVELHGKMQAEQEVPMFCWLLFARDTSEDPRTLLSNHLSQVGFSGGLEQVEMFLLGYALQHTIQTFRLYKTDTEEFVTHYPDDHKQDWPCVCIVTEDDRHYNVPIRKRAQHQLNHDLSALWPRLS